MLPTCTLIGIGYGGEGEQLPILMINSKWLSQRFNEDNCTLSGNQPTSLNAIRNNEVFVKCYC